MWPRALIVFVTPSICNLYTHCIFVDDCPSWQYLFYRLILRKRVKMSGKYTKRFLLFIMLNELLDFSRKLGSCFLKKFVHRTPIITDKKGTWCFKIYIESDTIVQVQNFTIKFDTR